MTEPKLESMLNKIFEKRTGIDFTINPELKDAKLFGEVINLPVRELLLILYDIELQFDIRVPTQTILDGKFDSYFHIAELIALQYDNDNKLRKGVLV